MTLVGFLGRLATCQLGGKPFPRRSPRRLRDPQATDGTNGRAGNLRPAERTGGPC